MDKNEHAEHFKQRLAGIFERKAQEFSKHSEADAVIAPVAAQLAGLYNELVELMKA